ncbi:MAG: hypothetical protein HYS75_02750 [Nitrosopumilales archaeon]|nr:hypothetical protein [Nitrosopumilales archaeon]
MISKKTGVGISAGIVISAIGIFALITSLGIQNILVDEKLEVGEFTSYQFNAPKHSREILSMTGDAFHVKVQTPGMGLQVDDDFKKEVSFEWFVLEDGQNRIEIQNIGNSEIYIEGTFEGFNDPLLLTFHGLVITTGVVIIGFSVGFARKHRGF